MKNIVKYTLLFLIILIFSSTAFASDVEVNMSSIVDEDVFNLTVENNNTLNSIFSDNDECSHPLKKSILNNNSLNKSYNSVYFINPINVKYYFVDGVLKNDYKNSILIFRGNFVDNGVLSIKSDNVTIIGNKSLFNNTVFSLESNNIMLTDLNFILNKEFADNGYSGILVLGNNCTIYNCTMNYTVPEATNGFCIYSKGNFRNKVQNFALINNTFNFIGNNMYGGWDYGIFIDYTDNALIYGNLISTTLPLRSVNWMVFTYGGVSMDAVGALVIQACDNLIISENKIISYISCGGDNYPTFDTVIIYDCNNVTVEKNYIYCEDFDSNDGKDNYLQGIDLYYVNDIKILYNQIHIRTTGGRSGMGTAYPIQVNGPSVNVKIAYNNLSSVNFGPNVGIYSQNYYGSTNIDIISNFINITGFASSDFWALVAGVELQDSDDLVWNNTIIVTNIGNYSDNNNIYGISYSQNTKGNHTYNIQYNNVTTNGLYAVSLSARESLVVNSIVANNILRSNTNVGNRAVRIGSGVNNTIRNNTGDFFKNILTDNDIPLWLKNHRSIIPYFNIPTFSNNDYNELFKPKYEINRFNNHSNNFGKVYGRQGMFNDSFSYYNYGISLGFNGLIKPSGSIFSSKDSSVSSYDNVYEINKKNNTIVKSIDYLNSIFLCIIIIFLLIIGYKFKYGEN